METLTTIKTETLRTTSFVDKIPDHAIMPDHAIIGWTSDGYVIHTGPDGKLYKHGVAKDPEEALKQIY